MSTSTASTKVNLNAIKLGDLRKEDVLLVGGKSAALGESMVLLSDLGIRVPDGFSTTASAYQRFLSENGLLEKITSLLSQVDTKHSHSLSNAASQIRKWILDGSFSGELVRDIETQLNRLTVLGVKSVAVRSSATAEDLPDASFAGQQETLLNVPAKIKPLLLAIKRVIASLFTDRAIAYRTEKGFEHSKVYLCACVQQMVRSDKAVAGVMFTSDSESGHRGVIGITAVWGLGEQAVGGANADEYILGKPLMDGGPAPLLNKRRGDQRQQMVFVTGNVADGPNKHYTKLVPTTRSQRSKFCLSHKDLEELARMAIITEKHYDMPMDIEWAKCGVTHAIYMVQSRPITVNRDIGKYIETFTIEPGDLPRIASGTAVGTRVAVGTVRILLDSSPEELAKIREGDILVARMTDPNYVPAMRLAAGIVTEEGSTKCHAAIIARELGVPAIVACSGVLTTLKDGQTVTVSCAEGTDGFIYDGEAKFHHHKTIIEHLPPTRAKIKMNLGDPGLALRSALIPNNGVGLARQELIIRNEIGIHPGACIDHKSLSAGLRQKIDRLIVGYPNAEEFYVSRLACGIGLIARAFYPQRVIVRLSDFKTNEYRGLIGGELYEPHEENPMLGYRGAARYLDKSFREAFQLECRALKRVIGEMGLTNVDIMVPFVRTLHEGQSVIKLLAENGIVRTSDSAGMNIGMMCEVPSNVVLAKEFAEIFDFASIGSNDLTQLTLGADRDSGKNYGDERDPAVKRLIEQAVVAWQEAGKPIGICGQAPSDHAGYAEWLMEIGIDSMSLNPDSVLSVWKRLSSVPAVALAS